MTLGRRVTLARLRLAGRPWNMVARELQEWLERLSASNDDGLPPGDTEETPTTIEVGGTADIGTATTGWSPGDHAHALTTGIPAALGTTEAEGSSDAAPRLDHVHGRKIGVLQAGVLVAVERDINFVSGAAVVDNPGALRLDVTISGGEDGEFLAWIGL
jgi:hypothetical protein